MRDISVLGRTRIRTLEVLAAEQLLQLLPELGIRAGQLIEQCFMRRTLVGLTQGGARVDEDKLGHIDEVGDIEPGKTKKGTFTLTAGKYLLFCNEEGHMNAGMVTSFVVEP
jgi:uncharacterized cupredoxin-like copper-binding protein